MAGNFYYKQSTVNQEDIETNSRIRNNAFVTITGKNDIQLPIVGTGMASTYNPKGTGRAAPVLKDVKISLEGEAASLRRAEVSYTCFDMASFEELEKSLLVPGSEVTIEYGYAGPQKPSESGKYVFRVFDYSFKITKENYFDCSFKAVAKGSGADFEHIDITGTDKFANFSPKLFFITDFDWKDTVAPVQNMFDYIDYVVQGATGTDIESSAEDTYKIDKIIFGKRIKYDSGIEKANAFDPPHGKCGRLPDGGHYGVLKAPLHYSPANAIDAGVMEDTLITYITLEALVGIVNNFILKGHENNYQILFDTGYSALDCKFPAGRVWSPSPYKALFPYQKDTPENSYTPTDRNEYTVNKQDFITCNAFAEFSQEIYDEFRIDNNKLGENVQAPSDVITGSPSGILLTRDVLREIQSSFDSKAIDEDESTEETEKANSKIDLISFFKKIFAVIRDNSGGDWDLYLDISEDLKDSNNKPVPPGTIFIVNKKAPVKSLVKPLMLSPTAGQNGIRELKLSGAVPKDIQAEAFGGAPTMSPTRTAAQIIAANEEALQKEIVLYNEKKEKLEAELPLAQTKINDDRYTQDATTAAKGLMKQLVETLKPSGLATRCKLMEPVPFPLTISIVLDGIEGFRFGDTITSNYLPSRYRLESGMRVVFTVTKYTHTIKGNDWQTELTCVSRIVED